MKKGLDEKVIIKNKISAKERMSVQRNWKLSIAAIYIWSERKNNIDLRLYRPCVCVRIQESVMSVVIVKYGSHKSSIYVSPKVCCIVLLKSLPENIEVIG